MNLKDILVKSVELNEQIGKSAALLMKFDNKNKNKLLTTNLGDSQYIIFRPKKNGREVEALFKSLRHEFAFNRPYLCGVHWNGSKLELPHNAIENSHEI